MRTALVTGGNSGIGKATATALALKGYRIIVHGRDPEKTLRAADEIKKTSGNENVEFIAADISCLRGMKELADAVRNKSDILHTLVLSTGIILPNRIITEDGLEKGFVVQYLSRFATTQLLMPELTKGKARIVHAGASVIPGARIHFEDLTLKNNFTMVRAMAQEMFANHLFVQEFARRYPGREVLMNMANVGVAKTGITRNVNFIFNLGVSLFGRSAQSASGNFVYLACEEAVTYSGFFLPKPGRPQVKEPIKYDPENAERLWKMSMELIRPIL